MNERWRETKHFNMNTPGRSMTLYLDIGGYQVSKCSLFERCDSMNHHNFLDNWGQMGSNLVRFPVLCRFVVRGNFFLRQDDSWDGPSQNKLDEKLNRRPRGPLLN